MTLDRDAIRRRAKDGLAVTSEVIALLDEVERLTREVEQLGLSCPVVGHDAPVEPVPEGMVQQAAPIRCPHCARELRRALDSLLANYEAAEDRERGWKIQAQAAEAEVERLTGELEVSDATLALTRLAEAPWIEEWRAATGQPDSLPDAGGLLLWARRRVEAAETAAQAGGTE